MQPTRVIDDGFPSTTTKVEHLDQEHIIEKVGVGVGSLRDIAARQVLLT